MLIRLISIFSELIPGNITQEAHKSYLECLYASNMTSNTVENKKALLNYLESESSKISEN